MRYAAGRSTCQEGFDVVGVIGHEFRAEETATVGRDEQIVFDADAAEILITLDGIEIQEVAVRAFGAPEIDEVGE